MPFEQEEISIKAAPSFSKGWNGDNCRSDNQRQHNILSREGFVLEITFVHFTDCSYWLIKNKLNNHWSFHSDKSQDYLHASVFNNLNSKGFPSIKTRIAGVLKFLSMNHNLIIVRMTSYG